MVGSYAVEVNPFVQITDLSNEFGSVGMSALSRLKVALFFHRITAQSHYVVYTQVEAIYQKVLSFFF